MRTLRNKVAVITGAGSGIGKALALELARQGCRLALNDIRQDSLQEAAEQIRKTGKTATIHEADIADRDQVTKFSNEVVNAHGRVDILVNNAGISMSRCGLPEISLDQWDAIFKVNFWGALHCIRAFFLALAQRDEAHIVNVSSINSLVPTSHRGAYCASKFAVRGLTETLIQETIGTHIRVTSVMPGLVATNIVLHASGWRDPVAQRDSYLFQQQASPTKPEKAAKKIVVGIRRNKKRILIGPDAWLLDTLYRLFPTLTLSLIHRIATHGEMNLIARLKQARQKELALQA